MTDEQFQKLLSTIEAGLNRVSYAILVAASSGDRLPTNAARDVRDLAEIMGRRKDE